VQRQSDVKQKPTRAPTIPGHAKKKPFLERQTEPLGLHPTQSQTPTH
jgi:hypothetical protein